VTSGDPDPFDDLLRGLLRYEAEDIHPAGDGLARIRSRVRERDWRRRWLRPAGVVAGAAAVGIGTAVALHYWSQSARHSDRLSVAEPATTSSNTEGQSLPAPSTVASPTASTTVTAVNTPAYFYGINNGQIARFSSGSGASVNYLTDDQSPGVASDPQRVGNDIYYLQAVSGCGNKLVNIPATSRDGDQTATTIVTPDDGYVIKHFGASGAITAIYETACDPQTVPQAQLVTFGLGASPHRVAFPAAPPLIDSEIAVTQTAGASVAFAVIRTGTQTYTARFDPATVDSTTPGDHLCGSLPGQAAAVAVSSSGHAYVAVQTGSSIEVLGCSATGSHAEFTATGNASPSTLSVTNDGSAFLLTDTAGHVWTSTRGVVDRLAVYNPVQTATW